MSGLVTDPDEAIRRAKEEDLVIVDVGRVGGRPYYKFSPYENHRGVRVHQWSCISYTFKAMPGRTLLSFPHIIEPDEHDGIDVRMFTDEWLWQEIHRSRGVELHSIDDTPFRGGLLEWES